jgi:hypothetical protein
VWGDSHTGGANAPDGSYTKVTPCLD